MRKAVAQVGRRKSRKENKNDKSSPDKSRGGGPPKMTPDEAALTAKNYRLAKELSELRVRHREECKTVTKLTMENMTLASRCREALTHVGVLKKELVKQQRRMDTLLKQQQQQQQQQQQPSETDATEEKKEDFKDLATIPPKLVSSDDYEEDDSAASSSADNNSSGSSSSPSRNSNKLSPLRQLTKRLPSTTTVRAFLRPPSQNSPTTAAAATTTTTTTASTTATQTIASNREDKISSPIDLDDDEEEGEQPGPESPKKPASSPSQKSSPSTATTFFSSPSKDTKRIFPSSASPKLSSSPPRGKNYNEEYPSDITAGSSSMMRYHSMSPRLGRFQEEPDTSTTTSSTTLSSIDAFEASFLQQTSFPSSFSPEEGKKKGDAYNPFQSSPQRTLATVREKKTSAAAAASTTTTTTTTSTTESSSSPTKQQQQQQQPSTPPPAAAVETNDLTTTSSPAVVVSPVTKPTAVTPTIGKENATKTSSAANSNVVEEMNKLESSTLPDGGSSSSSSKQQQPAILSIKRYHPPDTSPGASPVIPATKGQSIRDRATAAALLRRSSQGNTRLADPPGKDRTSTRKSGPLGQLQQQQQQRKATKPSSPVTNKFSLTTPEVPKKKNGYNKVSSPALLQPALSPVQKTNTGSTPSTPPLSPVLVGSVVEPARPEKSGFGQARARYELALRPDDSSSSSSSSSSPRRKQQEIPVSSPQPKPKSNGNSPGLRERIAAYSESVKTGSPNKKAFSPWPDSAPPSDEEGEEGQIPMKSKANHRPTPPEMRRMWEQGETTAA